MTSQSAPPEEFIKAYVDYFGVTEWEARREWDYGREDSEFSFFWRAAQAAQAEKDAKIAEEYKAPPESLGFGALGIEGWGWASENIAAAIRAAAGEGKE